MIDNVVDMKEWESEKDKKLLEYHRLEKRLREIALINNIEHTRISTVAHRFPRFYKEIVEITEKQINILTNL